MIEENTGCRLPNLPDLQEKQIKSDLETYGREILDSAEMQEAYHQTHHKWSTVGEHTLRVAAASLVICYALRKIHIHTDIAAVVKASLSHDLGILGRDRKYHSKGECSRQHPLDSVTVARKLVKDLPDKSADIIERHMWPGGHSKAPNSLEGVIVSTADKYAAVKDLVVGSEVKHTGLRNLSRDLRSSRKLLLHRSRKL